MAIQPLVKHPNEIRNYNCNFGFQPELRDGGQTLSIPIVAVVGTPNDLSLGPPTIAGSRVVFTISGGTDGGDYTIRCQANLSGGGDLCRDLPLLVRATDP